MVSLSLLLPLFASRQVGSLRWEDTVWDQRAGKPYRIMEPVVRALLLPLLASRQVGSSRVSDQRGGWREPT